MVVRELRDRRHACAGQRGLTLVELLVAIAMSTVVVLLAFGLLKDVGFTARLLSGKRGATFEAQAAFASMADNLMTGGGILSLGPDQADLLNRRNRRVTYRWGDSALAVNGVAWKFRLASLTLEAAGPVRPDWKAFSGGMPWELDSLDSDRNGRLDFEELDLDRDGDLNPEEARFVASIRLTLVANHRGVPLVQTCLIHPRNRVPAVQGSTAQDWSADGTDAGDIPGTWGIPEP